MRLRPASLTARLVVTAVSLVVVVSVLIGVFATLAIHDRLTDQVDDQLRDATRSIAGGPGPGPGGDGNRRPDTVTAFFPDDESVDADGELAGLGRDEDDALEADVLDRLAGVAADDDISTVDLPGLGDYRVTAIEASRIDGGEPEPGTLVVGLPTREVDDAVASLVGYEAVLVLAGGVLAAGAALVVVRRQLRPLREVAGTAHLVSELPLSQGEIQLSERVPAHLTDEATEVGRVGAALNRLLAHVETSLDARHASEQRVRQFVADASHELRTPLTTIAGYTELARRRPDDPETAATALTKVADESKRMTALVEDLLLLARLDSGRPLERTPVDLTRLLLEAVSDARVVAPDHQWRLVLPDEAVEVAGDEQRLHQVVTNLLTNARKYTPPGTTVTVTARADGFTVHDDGPGFEPELVPHAFERFARADAARQREGGVGLGLALVEAIITAHGGTVALASEPGDTRVDVRIS
ncbi:MAG: ATP-binding region, ATPase domain protein [Nocardioides sp.]|nr:ATP-binding region, ATPase domain protein [Nocardioides sp.]